MAFGGPPSDPWLFEWVRGAPQKSTFRLKTSIFRISRFGVLSGLGPTQLVPCLRYPNCGSGLPAATSHRHISYGITSGSNSLGLGSIILVEFHSVRDFAKGIAGTVSLPIFSVFFRFLPFFSVFFRFFPFSSVFFCFHFFSRGKLWGISPPPLRSVSNQGRNCESIFFFCPTRHFFGECQSRFTGEI